ncbi:MAG: alanine racemase [Gemmatimonadales bacterium]|nr:alanine racemase [Gemmatimonadales bacterium]
MPTIHDLPTPALLLDLDVLDANLRWMADRTGELGVALRPHIKTHKCIEIGRRQRELGARGVTVSTLAEAATFAAHGFEDITWAFPVSPNRAAEIRSLADRVTLRLVVDSPEAVAALEQLGIPLHVWLKVDCGYHRAGVDPASPHAVALAERLAAAPALTFDGILSHSGHAYDGPSRAEVRRAAEQERDTMVSFAASLEDRGIAVPGVSVGSTPAMSVIDHLEGVTEARPGNYAFFDYTQVVLGSCGVRNCAVTVLATVISSQPGAGHSVTDAGALALSKDTGHAAAPDATMGEVFADYAAGTLEPSIHLTSLSQEHGKLSAALPVGNRVRILPNHSCLTVACFDAYHVVHGEDVIDEWRIRRER